MPYKSTFPPRKGSAILGAMRLNLEEIRAIAELVQKQGLDGIVVESTDADEPACRLELRREVPVVAAPAPIAGEDAVEAAPGTATHEQTLLITSPTVGIFRYGEEGLKVGQQIKELQVVGAVESLRVPNEVRASSSGIIEAVLVENGQGVEFAQPLLEIRLGH